MSYRFFSHTADLGVVISGHSPGELFVQAAFAVFDLLTEIKEVAPLQTREITAEGVNWEDLLINYLREVLYLYQGDRMLMKEFAVLEIDEKHVVAHLTGESFHPARHVIRRELKAVTYHGLTVRRTGEQWEARVIFDV